MLLALYAFFCKISDPNFGGTYMTLFNTFYYLGFMFSNTICLKLVAILTFNKCSNDVQNLCDSQDLINVRLSQCFFFYQTSLCYLSHNKLFVAKYSNIFIIIMYEVSTETKCTEALMSRGNFILICWPHCRLGLLLPLKTSHESC